MRKYDAIVLLGLKLRAGGEPAEELVLRAKRAAECYFEGIAPRILACGGDTGEGISEAAVMRRLLLEAGVPEAAITCEDRSRITYENLRNALYLLKKDRRRVFLVTSDYHLPRARLMARREGARQVSGSSIKTPGGRKKRQQIRIECLAAIDYLIGWGRRDETRPAWAEKLKRFLLRKNGR